MNPTNLLPYQERLTAELAILTDELATIAVHHEATDDWEAIPATEELSSADENTEADAVEEWNERRATVALLERRYHNVKRALMKIEAGTFGMCEISGESIETDRLDANPAARTCKAHLNDEETLPY